jgi:hypothetical protein
MTPASRRRKRERDIHKTKKEDAEEGHLQPTTHLETHQYPERNSQDENVGDNNNSVIRVVEDAVVDARALETRIPVHRNRVTLKQRDEKDSDHGPQVNAVQNPDRPLDLPFRTRQLKVEE